MVGERETSFNVVVMEEGEEEKNSVGEPEFVLSFFCEG